MICEQSGVTSGISECLGRLMEANDWGYRELAKCLDVPLSMAHGWATGGTVPRLKNIQYIAKKLKRYGVSLADLVA